MAQIRVSILDPSGSKKSIVELPDNVNIERLISALVRRMGFPNDLNGREVSYRLTHLVNDQKNELRSDRTLMEEQVRQDDMLHLHADMHAACFPAGTLISLPDGTKRFIEDLQPGDNVQSYDTDSHTFCPGVISAVKHDVSDSYLVINNTLRVTKSHFVFSDNQWLRAQDLARGNYLFNENGQHFAVDTLQEIHVPVQVYNLHLENRAHTFFAEGYLVHNYAVKTIGGVGAESSQVQVSPVLGPPLPPSELLNINLEKGKPLKVELTDEERLRLVNLVADEVDIRITESQIKTIGEIKTTLEEQRKVDELTRKAEDESRTLMQLRPILGIPEQGEQFQCDVFMIMPFRDQLDIIYSDIIQPVVSELGLTIKKGNDFHGKQGEIMKEVWYALCACKLVIVDCTAIDNQVNGNVYYELGLADVLGRSSVLIAQNLDLVPFDLRHRRFITYQDSYAGGKKLRESLKVAISKILNDLNGLNQS